MSATEWTGTDQHPNARDLSPYLVHLTRSRADLESILTSGVIEARNPFGIARTRVIAGGTQNAVCLTETPIPELKRMTSRGRVYGIVFAKERLRVDFGATPVWYVTDDSAQHLAIRSLMDSSANPTDPIWRLTPLIDVVIDSPRLRYDFRWEREWRVNGDLVFPNGAVAALLIPDASGELEAVRATVGNYLFVTPDEDFFWAGNADELQEDAFKLLIDEFLEKFITVDEAGLPLDREAEYGLAAVVPIIEATDAVYELFEELPEPIRDSLADQIQDTSQLWCRRDDVDHAHE